MEQKKIVVIGSIFQDLFLRLDNIPTLIISEENEEQHFLLIKEGKKVPVKALHIALGGGGANVATTCALFGNSVYICSAVGNDEAGDFVLKKLEKNGINIDFVKKVDKKTAFSIIFPAKSGNSTPFAYLGANDTEIAYDASLFKNTVATYFAPLHESNRTQFKTLISAAKNQGSLIFCNPSVEQIKNKELFDNISFIDILQCNYLEATIFFKIHMSEKRGGQALLLQSNFGLDFFCKTLIEKGVKIVIVTNGKEGVYVAHKNTLYFLKSPDIKIKNTVGAGDAFGAAFFCSYLENNSIEDAIKSGMTNSCIVLESNDLSAEALAKADATSGLLSKKEFEQKKETLFFNIVSFKI